MNRYKHSRQTRSNPGVSGSLIAAVAVILCSGLAGPEEVPSQTSANGSAASADHTPLKLKVESNLVMVRAIVRDARGRPVENLRKEDFRLFDNGKEQTITQFGVEVRPFASSPSTSLQSPQKGTGELPPSAPEHFVAFYFDDLDMPFDDIVRTRDAVDHYLAANLGPSDRAGVFTSSGTVAVDFTSDRKQLHQGLFRLQASSRLGGGCPWITDYQAKLIVDSDPDRGPGVASSSPVAPASSNPGGLMAQGPAFSQGPSSPGQAPPNPGSDAVALAISECNLSAQNALALNHVVYEQARRIFGQAEWQAQFSLQGLKDAVNHISDMPGQRSVILISAGFLTSELGSQVDDIVDRALRSQVVISSIDSKGLAVMVPEADVRVNATMGMTSAQLMAAKRDMLFNREQHALSVLLQVAEDTGGVFFHNDNDVNLGIHQVATLSEFGYVLGFSPKNLKPNGRFHSLKVTLSEHLPGVTLQARRGYFAPKNAVKEEDETQEKIRQVVLSREETQQFPLYVSTELSKASGNAEFSVMARVDARPVHFEKVGDRNLNTLTFIAAIFDRNGAWVTGEQKQVHLNLPDASLQKLFTSAGILVRTTFQLRPGTYTVREVVIESQEHHLAAVSRDVEIP
jgi:VWFA-related protein